MMRLSSQLVCFLMIVLAAAGRAAPPRPIYPNPSQLASNVAADANLYWSPGDHQLIVNGDFESGNLNGWSRLNEGGDTAINNGTYDPNSPDGPIAPIAGSFSTVNDQNGPGFQTIFQDITIPADAVSAVLSWSDRIRNHNPVFANTAPLQRFKVEIRNTNNAPLALIYSTEPGDVTLANPAKRRADITGFSGQRIRVAFTVEQNQFFFNVHLDNISVLVKSPGISYDVYFGTNATLGLNELVGTTTNSTWDIPVLRPLTTYFWRVNSRQGSEQTIGSVWQFTTPAVGSVDHFTWDIPPSPPSAGQPFPVTITAHDTANFVVTNYSETVVLSALAVDAETAQSLLNDPPFNAYAGYDRATVGYSFTPMTDILITGVRHTSGEKVSFWTDAGRLLATQSISGSPGVAQETSLLCPVQLYAGHRYRVGVYSSTLATNFARFDLTAAFPHGVIHQSYEGLGDNVPHVPHPARWWLVNPVYSVGPSRSVTVSPAAATFLNGSWTGNLIVNDPVDSLVLRAEDCTGHVGLAGRLAISTANRVRFTQANLFGTNVLVTFTTVPGRTYQLERTENLTGTNWVALLPNLPATATTMQISVPFGGDRQFYRVLALP